MPLYNYKCFNGHVHEVFLKLAELDLPVYCECGELAQRMLTAPAVHGDYPAYQCPVTGKPIEGRRAHQENLKRTGCRVYEPGETDNFKQRWAAEEDKFDRKLDHTVDSLIAGLPAAKREKLASEMEHGLTATVVRQ